MVRGVLHDVLIELLLAVGVASQQTRDCDQQGFFFDGPLLLVGDKVTEKPDDLQTDEHVLLLDDFVSEHTPIFCLPLAGWGGQCLVLQLDDLSDDLEADDPEVRLDVGVDV